MPEKILRCLNPDCSRYFRESKGDGLFCCRKCRAEIDFEFLEHDKKMQMVLKQGHDAQEEVSSGA